MSASWSVALVAVASACGYAQPTLEAASIKPADPSQTSSFTNTSAGLLTLDSISLKHCIERAFRVKDFSLPGPSWLSSERFNIVAKPPHDTPREKFNDMLQT